MPQPSGDYGGHPYLLLHAMVGYRKVHPTVYTQRSRTAGILHQKCHKISLATGPRVFWIRKRFNGKAIYVRHVRARDA